MRADTITVLDSIRSMGLLRKCGEPIESGMKAAKTRADAIHGIQSSWGGFQLMLNNRRYTTLAKVSYPRFQGWNPVAAEIRPLVQELSMRVVSERPWSETEKADIARSLAWDLATTLLEVEFSDIMRPLFNLERVLPIYEAGYLPCRWLGPKIDEAWAGASDADVPEGQVVSF